MKIKRFKPRKFNNGTIMPPKWLDALRTQIKYKIWQVLAL